MVVPLLVVVAVVLLLVAMATVVVLDVGSPDIRIVAASSCVGNACGIDCDHIDRAILILLLGRSLLDQELLHVLLDRAMLLVICGSLSCVISNVAFTV